LYPRKQIFYMRGTTENPLLAPIITGKLLNIGGMLQRKGNQILKPFGLNQQQFSIFFEIAKVGKVKQKDMVNRLLLERAHVSKVVKKLQEMGLIAVMTSDDDKRSCWLSVTSKGNETLTKCMELFEIWNKAWINLIDERQLASMLENLTELQNVFKIKTQEKI
jgi:DNA-binding MarR family transcriptional regulator